MKMERRSTGREDEEFSDEDNVTAKDIPPIPEVKEDEIQISISSDFNFRGGPKERRKGRGQCGDIHAAQ